MAKALPPLSALMAFEAVARRLSFSRAAEELHVTPGAVSQQVRALEERVGEALFTRTRRSVALTGAAHAMLSDVQSALQLISRAMNERSPSAPATSLTISVAPSFASKWLLPRLPRFTGRHPEIDLRISATVSLAEFGRDGPDLAIRFGRGDYPDLQSEKLLSETITPLCSAQLRKARALRRPQDLERVRLLHDTSIPGVSPSGAWARWLEAAGTPQVRTDGGITFTLAEHALQAAIDGAGVVLGRLVLAEGDIDAGRLVRPFRLALPLDAGYFLVMPKRRRERPEMHAFRDWIFTEVSRTTVARESAVRKAARAR